jgi:redox-sensitive bicupin YhaK (pirin superfamily)
MEKTRKIQKLIKSKPTMEGAGVHLNRVFGFGNTSEFDPFLLLDDFRSTEPSHFLAGFPWHPHRGIETITYILDGKIEHGDSLGNEGVIEPGDVQWMTAGSGIIHQEMPKGDEAGHMGGFQLWANLPASHKMMEPRYRDVKSEQIPEVSTKGGVKIRVISGQVDGTQGPVQDIITNPAYLDVSVPAGTEYIHSTRSGDTVFAYVIAGKARFCLEKDECNYAVEGEDSANIYRDGFAENGELVLFGDGKQVAVTTKTEPVRFLLLSGKPIGEPVAWAGPIVMNTQAELQVAFEEYRNGTFIKKINIR